MKKKNTFCAQIWRNQNFCSKMENPELQEVHWAKFSINLGFYSRKWKKQIKINKIVSKLCKMQEIESRSYHQTWSKSEVVSWVQNRLQKLASVKKFLKKSELRDWLRVVATDKDPYTLRSVKAMIRLLNRIRSDDKVMIRWTNTEQRTYIKARGKCTAKE